MFPVLCSVLCTDCFWNLFTTLPSTCSWQRPALGSPWKQVFASVLAGPVLGMLHQVLNEVVHKETVPCCRHVKLPLRLFQGGPELHMPPPPDPVFAAHFVQNDRVNKPKDWTCKHCETTTFRGGPAPGRCKEHLRKCAKVP
jgi:hypothetical protein